MMAATLLLGTSLASGTAAAEQTNFATPEAAVQALLDGLKNRDLDALSNLFGPDHMDALIGPDKVAVREGMKQIYEKATSAHVLSPGAQGGMTLVIGPEAWPFPIPIVQDGGRWRYDTEAGLQEVLNRRIGQNELSAIAALREYVEAQVEYAGEDRDADEVLEYAQQIASSPGKRDGLYWPSSGADEVSPFGPFVAEAASYLDGRQPGDPFKGYFFRILTRQGDAAPGGRYDYAINGNMIAGFGMIAFPAEYGNSGIMSLIVSHQGKVYERDLGEHTAVIAPMIQEYNPEGWSEVTD